MPSKLRLLIIDDSQDDADLILLELRRSGYEIDQERVENAAGLEAALTRESWDLVICDYSMPQVSPAEALEIVQERGLDIPFIIVSGTIGEDAAVSMMKAGAHDYIMKSNLNRLGAAVRRELHEAFLRAEGEDAQAALTQSVTRYRRIIETSYEGVWTIDEDSRTDFVNDRMAKMLGYTPAELLGRSFFDFMDDEGRAEANKYLERRQSGIAEQHEFKLLRKDGTNLWALLSMSSIFDERQQYIGALAMVSDITARKSLEEQFRQAQKMEAIGRLAGGIAHDFNNLLTVILGYSALVMRGLRPGDPMLEDLGEVQKAADRAAVLTRQLLTVSRRQVVQLKPLNLNDIIANMDKMLRRLIGEDVELVTAATPGLGTVDADAGQIDQVIMNLALNARDAMREGGRLTIETANVDLDETFARDHIGVAPGPHVMLAVSDTGSGMDKATQARIFEPFFTTKEMGRGTGFGLSTVFGIVKQFEGSVWVYSELGKGTTFKIYLPRSAQATGAVAPKPVAVSTVRGTETILLAEDEDQVRNLTREILRRHGYRVLESRNGGEAFLTCEQYQGPIHLLLTDVIMPQMSGRQLADRLTLLRPEMKTLYMSGYPDNAIVHHGVLKAGIAYLQKPLTPDVLLRKVREVLETPLPSPS